MALTAADSVDLESAETDDTAWHSDVRSNHVCKASSCLASTIDDSNLHLFEVCIEAKLAQVIDSTSIELILSRQE